MDRWLEEELERLRTRDRIVAAARARTMSKLFELVQRRHDPLAYEKQADHEEEETGDFR